jgi:predicted tellurium resistance membrane protein TerC
MFGQTFEAHDIAVVALLVVLEGVLSIDNALVLGLLAKRLPKHQQSRALTYGLVGAFVFRLIAVGTAVFLMRWWWVKLLGGGYLVYIAVKHLFFEAKEQTHEHITVSPEGGPMLVDDRTGQEISQEAAEIEIKERVPVPLPNAVEHGGEISTAPSSSPSPPPQPGSQAQPTAMGTLRKYAKFWPTVIVIELTDIAFAIDSILAAIALAGSRPEKLWVVLAGGMFGVILMRFAAIIFIRMLEKFPRFELAAYLLVIIIGLKLLADWFFNKPPADWPVGTAYHGPLDFHSPVSVAFWVFWILMLLAFCIGFIPKKESKPENAAA